MYAKRSLVFGYVREYCKTNQIELIPDDIIELFLSWTSFPDHFEKSKCHPNLLLVIDENAAYESIKPMVSDEFEGHSYASAIGQQIIHKGLKQEWHFQVKELCGFCILIGIVDNDVVHSNESITDFTNGEYEGYGIYGASGVKYNGESSETTYSYASQFDFVKNDKITMILDLTQKENKNGVLSFIFHATLKETADLENNTNIAYDNIDIENAYRCAIALHTSIDDEIALLLQ